VPSAYHCPHCGEYHLADSHWCDRTGEPLPRCEILGEEIDLGVVAEPSVACSIRVRNAGAGTLVVHPTVPPGVGWVESGVDEVEIPAGNEGVVPLKVVRVRLEQRGESVAQVGVEALCPRQSRGPQPIGTRTVTVRAHRRASPIAIASTSLLRMSCPAGSAAVARVTLRNAGDAPLTVGSPALGATKLTVSPVDGRTIAPDGEQVYDLSASVPSGRLETWVEFPTDDSLHPVLRVQVLCEAGPAALPRARLSAESVELRPDRSTATLALSNAGTAALRVTRIIRSVGWLAVEPSGPVDLLPGEECAFAFSAPDAQVDALREATPIPIVVETTDPERPRLGATVIVFPTRRPGRAAEHDGLVVEFDEPEAAPTTPDDDLRISIGHIGPAAPEATEPPGEHDGLVVEFDPDED